jgi:hypothetical protein
LFIFERVGFLPGETREDKTMFVVRVLVAIDIEDFEAIRHETSCFFPFASAVFDGGCYINVKKVLERLFSRVFLLLNRTGITQITLDANHACLESTLHLQWFGKTL